jgi:hypothetical protein
MFERACDTMNTAPLCDLIDLFEAYKDQRDFLEDNIEIRVKRRIVEEIDHASAKEIVTLLNSFRNDLTFRKYMAYTLLERFDKGIDVEA